MSELESGASVPDDVCNETQYQKPGKKGYRVWTKKEELEMLEAMKKAKSAGLKTKQGFKTSGLMFIENHLQEKFPGTDLQVRPHIVNRVRTCK